MTFPFEKTENIISETQFIIDRETARQRMVLLNKLKAAPGQANRAIITQFLVVKKWIEFGQTCDFWPLKHMPKNEAELLSLTNDIQRFEMSLNQPEIVP